MEVKKTVTIPAKTEDRTDHYVCDLCEAKTLTNGRWPGQKGNASETTIEMKVGNSWGTDGGDVRTTTFHVCIDCFRSKLVPWFTSQGATPTTADRDY